jgi:hypothetical protein
MLLNSNGCKKKIPFCYNIVAFLWNFFLSKEAATVERRYEKERQSVKLHACKRHLVQGHVRIFGAVIGHLEAEIDF